MSATIGKRIVLCVHGTASASPAWLDALCAQLPADAGLALLGAQAALAPEREATRRATLDGAAPDGNDAAQWAAALSADWPDADLLLVRSDAEVPAHAVERLRLALAATSVGAVCALDNLDPALSPLPPGTASTEPAARIDALCHAWGEQRVVDVARPSRLLSLWRGPCAVDATCAALDHLYVGARGVPLEGPAADADPRDPMPPSPLDGLRERVAAALATPAWPALHGRGGRPVLLHVLHGWGGGAQRWVRDFAAAFTAADHLVLIARGSHARRRHGEWLELHDGRLDGPPLRRVALPRPIVDTAIADAGYRRVFEAWLAEFGVAAVIVSSLIGHSLDALRSGLPCLRVIHDHYPLWPVLHRDFGDPRLPFDEAQRAADLAARGGDFEFTERDPARWRALRDAFVAALLEARATLVAPSRSALANERRLAPELAALDARVIAHGIAAWPGADGERLPAPPPREKLRLVVPGRVRLGKGAELLAAVLPRLRGRAEVFLLGAGADAAAFFGQRDVHIVLDYAHAELPRLLRTLAPDAALLLPTVAETFGYTLSELRALGLPVLATRLGAYVERIDDGVDGFLVDAEAEAIVRRIESLAAERDALARVRAHLAVVDEPDLAAMAAGYVPLLASLTAHPRPAPRPLDVAVLDAAASARARARQQARIERLTDERDAAQAESARRGEWGHALDRRLGETGLQLTALEEQLDDRTAWALRLDAERVEQDARIATLSHYQQDYEAVIRSRSWRLTVPLRQATTRLRAWRTALAFRKARLASAFGRVRGSLARRGWRGTFARIAQELRGGAAPNLMPIAQAPAADAPFEPFALPASDSPRVSIVIPVHDKFPYTAACLRSLAETAGPTPFEVIVVDDLSSDETAERLAQIGGLRSLRNAQNLGFVGSCNAGAAAAHGEYVVFLNNDTVVRTGWIEALLAVFEQEPDAGLVGARLVYPDGRLQEAGGIVFSDGSGWNYGRFDDPDDARYAFRREADYCSGAAIMLPRALFERLGGFDARYAPAYYEDTDLAFAVRAAGLKVYYEPRATVIHFEGITAGTDTASGVKRYQVVNREKFLAKWADALAAQPPAGTDPALAATHRATRRVLIIDATTPQPDHDSGSLRMVNLMRVLRGLGAQVSFMAENRAWVERYTADLQALGVEVLYHPWVADPVALFRERGREFDAIVLSRHYVAAHYVGLARLYAPKARLVFDTVDLHYLREQRAFELEGRPELARQAAATRAQELKLMRECDVTVVVSPVERGILAVDAPGARVRVLSNVHEVFGCRRDYAERHDLVFVGGFQHPPNTDAVEWFVREAFARVRAALQDVRLHVIGSKVPETIRALADEHVLVHGFVEDIAPFMDGCRISIAPLRYGAGVKGKVNMAMSYGLPVVATPIAVEGMHVRDGEDVLVGADADAFAAAIVRVYEDEALWTRLSRNGLANVERHFSFAAARASVLDILDGD